MYNETYLLFIKERKCEIYSFSCSSSPHNSVSEGAFFRLQAIAEPITSRLIKYIIIVMVWFLIIQRKHIQTVYVHFEYEIAVYLSDLSRYSVGVMPIFCLKHLLK